MNALVPDFVFSKENNVEKHRTKYIENKFPFSLEWPN